MGAFCGCTAGIVFVTTTRLGVGIGCCIPDCARPDTADVPKTTRPAKTLFFINFGWRAALECLISKRLLVSTYKILANDTRLSILFEKIIAYTNIPYGCFRVVSRPSIRYNYDFDAVKAELSL